MMRIIFLKKADIIILCFRANYWKTKFGIIGDEDLRKAMCVIDKDVKNQRIFFKRIDLEA
jgi:hypothetical protein